MNIQDNSASTLAVANIATGVTAGSGVLTFLNENAGAIGVMLSAFSLLVALIFYILNFRLKSRALKMHRKEILAEIMPDIAAALEEAGVSEQQQALTRTKVERRVHVYT